MLESLSGTSTFAQLFCGNYVGIIKVGGPIRDLCVGKIILAELGRYY